MTKEQIAALIAAKIAGQGSMVDIGGALPEILTALAENGISTDMTVAEQMQARKNLGLYYEETTTGEKTVQYTDEVHTDTAPANYAKISDDTPSKDDIISIGSLGEPVQFSDKDDGFECYIEGAPSHTSYYIVLDDSLGHTPGIYYSPNGVEYASMVVLTYIGTVTTISKVPSRYLPIAWNQLVTEGTKIAEVTIGEETTNVFAPEGGGGLETVVLLQIPTTEQYNVDITEYMSLADFQKVVNFESIVAVYNSNQSFLITVEKELDFFENVICRLYFIDKNGNVPFWFYYDGISTYTINVNDNSTKAVITQLPTASMTSQELAEIGFDSVTLIKVLNGEKIGFGFQNYGYFPVLSADLNLVSGVIEFWSSTNKYVITYDVTMQTASCTVTPR